VRINRVIFVVGLALLISGWSTALASASSKRFEIQYSGSGTLDSNETVPTSPSCGDVNWTRTESTKFSWVDVWHLTLKVTKHGASGGSDKVEPTTIPDYTDSTVTYKANATGSCQDASANCQGDALPQKGVSAVFSVAGGDTSTRFKAQAVGGFVGWQAYDFSGSWTDPDQVFGFSSCSSAFSYHPPLLQPLPEPVASVEANFPVKVATLRSLPAGHYFKVKISPGHYAPSKSPYECESDDGCNSLHWDFSGTVRVTRQG
jgi:hypothetical protein